MLGGGGSWVGSSSGGSLGSKYIRSTRFYSVSSGTTGTITPPASAAFIPDDFGGTVDAVVTTIIGGRPTYTQAATSGATPITVSFNTSTGDYTLSGTPSSYPVAIVYRASQSLTDYDSTSSDIVSEGQLEGSGGGGGGSTSWGGISGTLSDQTDLQSALDAKVTGPASATDNAIARYDGTTGKLIQNSAATIADTSGDITAGKYNTVAISGASTPTLAVTGTSTISGSNTGDQNLSGYQLISSLAGDVRAVVLTGLSLATNQVIAATDTILQAFGYIQKQISDNLTTLTSHTGNTSNPHSTTASQVGLSNVDNTSDTNKPVSTAQQTALNLKANIASPTFTGTTTIPLLGGTVVLAENCSIELDPVLSADGTYSGITQAGTAGATLVFGDTCQLSTADSRWEKVDISVAAAAVGDARGKLGMCVLAAASDGDPTKMLLIGNIRADSKFPTFTIGAQVFASTSGNLVVTQPSTTDHVIRPIGSGNTADELYFNPSAIWWTHT